jgi:hypothetical protein
MSIRFVVLRFCVLLACINATARPAAANPAVTLTGSLSRNRSNHTATLLHNGQVLIAGGMGFPCSPGEPPVVRYCHSTTNNTAELYDPGTGTWRFTGSLSRRAWHSATLLPGGQVLVAGGLDDGWDIRNNRSYLNTAELYDPVTEVWRPTRNLNTIWGLNRSVLLPNGKVLAVGWTAAELFDPSTETWSLTAAPSAGGLLTVLADGAVLATSGGSSEVYDPATETWSSAGSLNAIRNISTATLLRNGQVLAIGARSDWRETVAELYDPATRTWSLTGPINYARDGGSYTATLLANGRILLAGGYDPAGPDGTLRSMELYDPATGIWKTMPSLVIPRTFHTATLLPNDKVLFAAGMDGDFDVGTVWHSSAELFDQRLPRPTSLSISANTVSQGECFTITAGNGMGMTLDVQYRLNGSLVHTITGWPKLNEEGRAENICTSLQTPIGTFEFTAIRNTETTQWVPISTWVTVTPTP